MVDNIVQMSLPYENKGQFNGYFYNIFKSKTSPNTKERNFEMLMPNQTEIKSLSKATANDLTVTNNSKIIVLHNQSR